MRDQLVMGAVGLCLGLQATALTIWTRPPPLLKGMFWGMCGWAPLGAGMLAYALAGHG